MEASKVLIHFGGAVTQPNTWKGTILLLVFECLPISDMSSARFWLRILAESKYGVLSSFHTHPFGAIAFHFLPNHPATIRRWLRWSTNHPNSGAFISKHWTFKCWNQHVSFTSPLKVSFCNIPTPTKEQTTNSFVETLFCDLCGVKKITINYRK